MRLLTHLPGLLLLCVARSVLALITLDDFESNVPYDSPKGKELLLSPNASLTTFFKISEHFVTQDTLAFCGPASVVIALNALNSSKTRHPVDKKYPGFPYYTQDNWISDECVKKTLGFFVMGGMDVVTLSKAIECSAYSDSIYVTGLENSNLVIRSIKKAMDQGHIIIANVLRTGLHELGSGHFSPLAAYHFDGVKTRFLFYDVSRYKYQPIWVVGEELLFAMSQVDPLSNHTRGFLIVSNSPLYNRFSRVVKQQKYSGLQKK